MIFFTNYYVILIAMAIFGLGVGIETLSVINNAWKYFPEHAALVNGIIITGLGISSGIFVASAAHFNGSVSVQGICSCTTGVETAGYL
jgi:hypothetical protein